MTATSETTGGGRRPPVAVVTGAAMGIGLAIARRLIADGIAVVGVDRDAGALATAERDLGPAFSALEGDVGDWATHERAADAAAERGRLAHWVSNAGIDIVGGAHEATSDEIERGLRVLQLGVLYGSSVAVRRMLATGGGSLVTISSIQGVAAFPRYYIYASAKAAVIAATRSIALDYAPHGIRANVVLPGCIETPMTYSTLPPGMDREEALRIEGELAPLGRVGQPSEVAEVVAFLLSERASYVTGTQTIVDGGAITRCFAYPPMESPKEP